MNFKKNKYGTALVLTKEEQEESYAQNVNDIMVRTRWFLDNLDKFPVFEYWLEDYRTGTGRHKKWKENPEYKKQPIGIGTTFNATGWMYNGDTRPVNLGK